MKQTDGEKMRRWESSWESKGGKKGGGGMRMGEKRRRRRRRINSPFSSSSDDEKVAERAADRRAFVSLSATQSAPKRTGPIRTFTLCHLETSTPHPRLQHVL
ncbi:hypothetical protein ATANTOWER_011036 [Ataeniobius toweri]|uniref:Uncharacterized protein n=1 Tax=Ataeniobius toweri TaxID=208326 RepID=A0ABU7AXX4_9TELE|nr:hypothetical protein [Ataeniobius toweri]